MKAFPKTDRPLIAATHELRFGSLVHEGRGCAFPCDEAGQVDRDGLSEVARDNDFYARTIVGRELAEPVVKASATH